MFGFEFEKHTAAFSVKKNTIFSTIFQFQWQCLKHIALKKKVPILTALDPFQVWLPSMETHTKSIAGGHSG